MDGCGKTTLLKRCNHTHPHWRTVHWRDRESAGIPIFSWGPDHAATLNSMPPLIRSLQIAGSHWTDYEYLIRPYHLKGETVISDSYYYKAMAKELLHNVCDPILFPLLRRLPPPDITVIIDTQPEIAFSRKRTISHYEAPGLTRSSFVQFQQMMMEHISAFARESTTFNINGNRSPNEVYQDFVDIVSSVLDLNNSPLGKG
jgi:thymidylate kinase